MTSIEKQQFVSSLAGKAAGFFARLVQFEGELAGYFDFGGGFENFERQGQIEAGVVFEHFADGDDFQLRIGRGHERMFVESGALGGSAHRFSRLLKRQKHPHFCVELGQDAHQSIYVTAPDTSRFDLKHEFGVGIGAGLGVGQAVYAAIGALFLVDLRAVVGVSENRPLFELFAGAVILFERQSPRRIHVGGHAVELDGIRHLFSKLRFQPPQHKHDGLIRDVNAQPLPPQSLRDGDGRSAPTKGIQHHIARIGRRENDAFEQPFRFLSFVLLFWLDFHLLRFFRVRRKQAPDVLKE